MMPSKTLRKAAPRNSALMGSLERRGHRASPRIALPAAGAGQGVPDGTQLMSGHSPVAVHDPGVEGRRLRTYTRCPSYSEPEVVTECALQLGKMGDKLNLRQRILNLIAKLFCPGTQECLE